MPPGDDTPLAVAVDGVWKRFRSPAERVHTLKERALHPLRRSGYEDFTALQDVSFGVRKGEFFGIVGRNGSGKSTLLKCLAGIYRADQGTIHVDGRMSTFIELGIGFNPDLAARDNVILNGIMLGLTPREARRRFERVIEFAELEDFVDLKLKNYSSGMQVRLAFSVMIQVDADVLLIDEVLAVGDAAFQQKCFDVFHRLRDEGRTILFVTHDMSSVRRFCHRALLLERGEMRIIGDPERVGNHYVELNFGRDHSAELPDTGEGVGDADVAPAEERYGDQAVQIVEAWFEDSAGERTTTLPQGAVAHFCMRMHVNEPVDGLNAAVLLENDEHHPLFATSSADADVETRAYGAGEQLVMRVSFEALLRPGRIFASPWVVRQNSSNLMDRRPRLVSAIVTGTRDTGGLLALPHDIRLESPAAA